MNYKALQLYASTKVLTQEERLKISRKNEIQEEIKNIINAKTSLDITAVFSHLEISVNL